MSTLHLTTNPVFHARTKHIEIDYYFVREKVALDFIVTHYALFSSQIVDIFTKSLPEDRLTLKLCNVGEDASFLADIESQSLIQGCNTVERSGIIFIICKALTLYARNMNRLFFGVCYFLPFACADLDMKSLLLTKDSLELA